MDAANYPIFKNILYSSRSDANVWFVSYMLADRPGPTTCRYFMWQLHRTATWVYLFLLTLD